MDRPITLAWWQQRRTRIAALAAGAVLLVAVMSLLLTQVSGRYLTVAANDITISTVTSGVFHDFVPLHGEITPRDTIALDAQQGGQVEKLLVQAGDMVVQGQPMIIFRNDQLQLDVLNGEGRLAESITQLQMQQNQLEATRAANAQALANIRYQIATLEHTAQRYDPLLGQGAIDAKSVEQVHDQLAYYRNLLPIQVETNARQDALRLRQLPGLQSEEASLQANLKATHNELDALVERAPVSGKVTALDLKVGENRNRGQALAEIVPPTGFKIAAKIDEYYLGRVRMGQTARVTINNADYGLHVARVYPQVKDGTFTIDLTFDGRAPDGLSPGATADGKLLLGSDSQGVILPSGAFLDASGGRYVFVVAGGAAKRRSVKLGRRNAEQVEVLGGLKPGDRVVTSDYASYDRIDRLNLK